MARQENSPPFRNFTPRPDSLADIQLREAWKRVAEKEACLSIKATYVKRRGESLEWQWNTLQRRMRMQEDDMERRWEMHQKNVEAKEAQLKRERQEVSRIHAYYYSRAMQADLECQQLRRTQEELARVHAQGRSTQHPRPQTQSRQSDPSRIPQTCSRPRWTANSPGCANASWFGPSQSFSSGNSTREDPRGRLKEYNENWNKIGPRASNIPLPAGMRWQDPSDSSNLNNNVNWTYTNTVVFFMLGAGAQNTEQLGSQASIKRAMAKMPRGDVQSLVEQLKLERIRWHPDRLGMRNNGNEGVNVKLRDNKKAKDVLLAVAELLVYCEARMQDFRR